LWKNERVRWWDDVRDLSQETFFVEHISTFLPTFLSFFSSLFPFQFYPFLLSFISALFYLIKYIFTLFEKFYLLFKTILEAFWCDLHHLAVFLISLFFSAFKWSIVSHLLLRWSRDSNQLPSSSAFTTRTGSFHRYNLGVCPTFFWLILLSVFYHASELFSGNLFFSFF